MAAISEATSSRPITKRTGGIAASPKCHVMGVDIWLPTYQSDRRMTNGAHTLGEIVPFGFPRPMALELIRTLVGKDMFTLEPKAKMNIRERDFTMRQVLETLKEGQINQGPSKDE